MFYERYSELCKKANLTPSAAATKAGFNRGTVSVWKKKYEEGKDVTPDPETIHKICVFFGCTEHWIRGIPEQFILTPDMIGLDKEPPSDRELEFFEWFRFQATDHQKKLIEMIMEGDK